MQGDVLGSRESKLYRVYANKYGLPYIKEAHDNDNEPQQIVSDIAFLNFIAHETRVLHALSVSPQNQQSSVAQPIFQESWPLERWLRVSMCLNVALCTGGAVTSLLVDGVAQTMTLGDILALTATFIVIIEIFALLVYAVLIGLSRDNGSR